MDDKIIPPSQKKLVDIYPSEKEFASVFQDKRQIETNYLPLSLSTIARYSNKTSVPEIRGCSMRKAISRLREAGLKFKLNGSGKVLSQSLKPGSLVDKGSMCVIRLK